MSKFFFVLLLARAANSQMLQSLLTYGKPGQARHKLYAYKLATKAKGWNRSYRTCRMLWLFAKPLVDIEVDGFYDWW